MTIEQVMEWTRAVGPVYGTQNRALFFYALVRMLGTSNVLELGTGLAASSFSIAQALRDNGAGHLWTVDNGEQWGWPSHRELPAKLGAIPLFAPLSDTTLSPQLLARAAKLLELVDWVTLLDGELGLVDSQPVDARRYPFLAGALSRPIDLLFADINSRPEACLILLRKYLPLMAEAASIFFDSASTLLPSYLSLEVTVEQLNHGKVPAFLLAGTTRAERDVVFELVATRRFSLTHLVEPRSVHQNSMAWLQIAPVNIAPYPLAAMRGFLEQADQAIPADALARYLRTAEGGAYAASGDAQNDDKAPQ